MEFDDVAHSKDDHPPSPPEANKGVPHAPTVSEVGRKGGRTTREKYGPDHFAAIGKKDGATIKAGTGPDHYCRLGQQGGQTSKARYGTKHFQDIGKKGGAALKVRANPVLTPAYNGSSQFLVSPGNLWQSLLHSPLNRCWRWHGHVALPVAGPARGTGNHCGDCHA